MPLRQQVFESVRSTGLIPRVDLAKQLHISPATVTALVSELLTEGLLIEESAPAAARPSGRGRPPVSLRVRPDAAFVAGIKLADTMHTGLIIDLSGTPVAEARLPRKRRSTSAEDVLEEAGEILEMLCRSAGLARSDLAGVGIGMPGAIEHETGKMLWSPLISGRNVPIRDLAQAHLGLPVEVDNDANMVTLAELWYGAGRGLSDFAVVTIEHGVGMGLVVGNQLYRGAHGVGMELGHTKVQLDGALCRCGQRGCLEAYVSDYALVREARVALELLGDPDATASGLMEQLYEQAKAGNMAARTIFRRAGRFLAVGLANVANLFDPSLIILSGERMRYDYLYNEEVLEEMQALTVNAEHMPQKVEINAWGDHVWARGAATLALSAATARLTARVAA